MTPENFCYWLQGYFEISDSKELTEKQINVIQSHLHLVFNKAPNLYRMPYKGGGGVSAYSGFVYNPSGSGYSGYC